MNLKKVALAKDVLEENSKVLYGIFGVVESSGFFPPREILNGFLSQGNDPCDQDGRMDGWQPMELNEREYAVIQTWWLGNNPKAKVESLEHDNWHDWIDEILENE
jgi:hypothetical protein